MIPIDRRIATSTRRIDIDDFEIFAARPRLKLRPRRIWLPSHLRKGIEERPSEGSYAKMQARIKGSGVFGADACARCSLPMLDNMARCAAAATEARARLPQRVDDLDATPERHAVPCAERASAYPVDVGVRQKCFDTGGLRKLKRFELEHPLTIRILVLYAETRQHLQEREARGIGSSFFGRPIAGSVASAACTRNAPCPKNFSRSGIVLFALPNSAARTISTFIQCSVQVLNAVLFFVIHKAAAAAICGVAADVPRPSKSTTELQPNFAHGMFHRPGQRRPDLPGRTRPMGRGNGFGIEALRDRWYGTRTRPCVLRIGIGCAEGILWTRARTTRVIPVRRCRWRARGQQ